MSVTPNASGAYRLARNGQKELAQQHIRPVPELSPLCPAERNAANASYCDEERQVWRGGCCYRGARQFACQYSARGAGAGTRCAGRAISY